MDLNIIMTAKMFILALVMNYDKYKDAFRNVWYV